MHPVRAFGRRTFASLSIRNYRLFFIGQGISQCGSWMQSIAQGLLVLELTGSGTALGLVIALQNVPVLLFGPWGGVMADRYPKRNILYVTQTAAGLLALTVGFETSKKKFTSRTFVPAMVVQETRTSSACASLINSASPFPASLIRALSMR